MVLVLFFSNSPAMYDSGFVICCIWSRLMQIGFRWPAHWSTMPEVDMKTSATIGTFYLNVKQASNKSWTWIGRISNLWPYVHVLWANTLIWKTFSILAEKHSLVKH